MHCSTILSFLPVLALPATAAPSSAKRASSTCPSYTIINTRGTGESQGQSAGFKTMNSRITSQLPGGTIYSTVYEAGWSQDSEAGTEDILDKIKSTLASSPDECFVLEGYSQGAAATVNALPQIAGDAFDAVKGVFLIGDPEHKAGLACNVDNNGGTTTKSARGMEASGSGGIPDNWVSKTLDVCIYGDGVCDAAHGFGITMQHLEYSSDSATQNLGTTFVVEKLGGSS
ncbi:A cutinase-like protein from cryptococcus Sp [Xylariaceae sp. FL0016]|nr:A cutinase-like protein from cryptococcus Sp [Xylariaceae sp. FL0016]